jgi:hypothetical protein
MVEGWKWNVSKNPLFQYSIVPIFQNSQESSNAIFKRLMILSFPRRGSVFTNSGPFILPVTAARRGA